MLARFQREPWSLMNRWRCDVERAYHGLEDGLSPNGELIAAGWAPAVDLKEEDGAYVLYVDLLGVDPKDIPLHMEDRALTLKRSASPKPRKTRIIIAESSASPVAFTADSRCLIRPMRRTSR